MTAATRPVGPGKNSSKNYDAISINWVQTSVRLSCQKILVKNLGQKSWSKNLVKNLGQKFWSKILFKNLGQKSCLQILVKNFGQKSWLKILVKNLDQKFWSKIWVKKCLDTIGLILWLKKKIWNLKKIFLDLFSRNSSKTFLDILCGFSKIFLRNVLLEKKRLIFSVKY